MGLEGELGWVGVLPRHEVAHPGDVIPLGKTEYRNTGINVRGLSELSQLLDELVRIQDTKPANISRRFYQRYLHGEGAIERVLAC